MQSTNGLRSFRAAAVLLAVPAVAAVQSARVHQAPRIHETADAVYITIDKPGAQATYALGISPDGKIVGTYRMVQGPDPTPFAYSDATGFLLDGNRFTDFEYPFFPSGGSIKVTWPTRMNAGGAIVGSWASQPPFASVEGGWTWKKGEFSEFKYTGPLPPDGDPTVAQITDVWGINSSGDMVGQLVYLKNLDAWNGSHGWLYEAGKGQFHILDVPGASWTWPVDINDSGDVIGTYQLGPPTEESPTRGFLRKKDNTYQDVAVPQEWNAQYQAPTGMNSDGVIVGYYGVDGPPHGYMLKNDRAISFDHPAAAFGTAPYGVNAAGVIVGCYMSADGVMHGYVRIPKGQL